MPVQLNDKTIILGYINKKGFWVSQCLTQVSHIHEYNHEYKVHPKSCCLGLSISSFFDFFDVCKSLLLKLF